MKKENGMKSNSIFMLFFALLMSTTPLMIASNPVQEQTQEPQKCCSCAAGTFGKDWTICMKLYGYMLSILKQGSAVIEFGSGWSSGELSRYLKVYSVEHDPKWLNKYNTNYIYAPIVDGWYDTEALKSQLPENYDLILVDGPPSTIGRGKFLDNIDLFKKNVPIIFDDVERAPERTLMIKTAELLQRTPIIMDCGHKKFAVLFPQDYKA